MRIGLIDLDSKLPNLAVMKIAAYHKARGDRVFFRDVPRDADRVYISGLFSKNRRQAQKVASMYSGEVLLGGTGWDFETVLPPEIENAAPDYGLYTPDLVYQRTNGGVGSRETKMKKATLLAESGLGFLYRGCSRTEKSCPWCVVPKKEGGLQRVAEIDDLMNPGAEMLTLLDNNLLAAPDALDLLHALRRPDIKLVNITQGIDARLVTPELAEALGQLRYFKDMLRYAWDHPSAESAVMRGIKRLTRHISPKRQMCYMLVGHSSEFGEDMYRFKRLAGLGVSPFAMIFDFNSAGDLRLKHFARWVNGRFYKSCSFEEYRPWVRDRDLYFSGSLL